MSLGSFPDVTEPAQLSTDGREIGARAKATRSRLLEATWKLLDRDGLLKLKLVDVTREVGASPATFYQYFTGLDDALLELCEMERVASNGLVTRLDGPWTTIEHYRACAGFVDGFLEHLDVYESVLRARNLKAEENDERFRRARLKSILPILDSLTEMVKINIEAGRLSDEIDPQAVSAGMVAMLERLVTYRRQLELGGTTPDGLRHTLVHILFATVTGLDRP